MEGIEENNIFRLGLLVRWQDRVRERALHGAALAEHAVVDEAGRQPLERLLHHVGLVHDQVVVAAPSPSAGLCSMWRVWGGNKHKTNFSVSGQVRILVHNRKQSLVQAWIGPCVVGEAFYERHWYL